MTDQTPIERSARELSSLSTGRVCAPSDPDIRWEGWVPDAKAAFESIDTDQLADVIAQRNHDPNSGQPWEVSAARAVKNWLTGNN